MKSIEKTLQRFLERDEHKVLAIKGDWGTGKTFFWNNFYERNKKSITQVAYSYVSLFGIKDISELKRQVFSKHVAINEENLKGQIRKLKSISTILKTLKLPYINNSQSIFEYFEDKFVKNFLICFDDIERKENSISLSAILGFISSLKEEKKCKILLIFNDTELSKDSEKDLNEYREKVVDLEIKYNPTIQDNFSLIFKDNQPKEILDIFLLLKLNNIRIMQRAKWALSYFEDDLRNKYPDIIKPFSRKVAILTCLYHAFSNRIKLDEVLHSRYSSVLLTKDEKLKERLSILKDIKYNYDSFDIVIVDYLINGYVDIDKTHSILETENESYRLGNLQGEHEAIMDFALSNFLESQKTFTERLFESVKSNIKDLKLYQIVNSLDFLKKIDADFNIDDVLDQCIDQFIEAGGKFDSDEKLGSHFPDYVVEKIKQRLGEKQETYSIPELMDRLAGSDSWNTVDIAKMEPFTEDDYFKWMTSDEDENLLMKIKIFTHRFGENETEKLIICRINSALEKISNRSQLDRIRVENIIGYKKD